MTARAALKRATRDIHQRLDAKLSCYRLDQRESYAAFLRAQAAAFLPVERALTGAGAGTIIPDWSSRIRGPLLKADLADLGIDRTAEVPPPVFPDQAALLGGIYVIEGSRMGAAVLARQVAAGLPRAFLSARPPAGWWSAIIATLERKLGSSVELASAQAAAERVFACFERAAGISPVYE